MSRPNKSDVAFWAGVTICALALCFYALFGCAKAAQSAQSLAAAAPLVDDSAAAQADEQAAHADEKAHQLVLDRIRAAVLVKVDEAAANAAESEPEAEQATDYYETEYVYQNQYSGGYTGGSTATTLSDLLNGQGRAYDEGGTSYTYYNHDIGNGPLYVPGEHFDDAGVSYDGDGYIVVAADGHEKGEVIDTPYGAAKVYDKGSGYGNIDIYTNR